MWERGLGHLMVLPARHARIGVAFLGMFYGLPFIAVGLVVPGLLGTMIALSGIALGALACGRGLRVFLGLEGDDLVVRNRWRTFRFGREESVTLEPVIPWWGILIGFSVDVLGVRRRGTRWAVPAIATIGHPLAPPDIARLARDLGRPELAPDSAPERPSP